MTWREGMDDRNRRFYGVAALTDAHDLVWCGACTRGVPIAKADKLVEGNILFPRGWRREPDGKLRRRVKGLMFGPSVPRPVWFVCPDCETEGIVPT